MLVLVSKLLLREGLLHGRIVENIVKRTFSLVGYTVSDHREFDLILLLHLFSRKFLLSDKGKSLAHSSQIFYSDSFVDQGNTL